MEETSSGHFAPPLNHSFSEPPMGLRNTSIVLERTDAQMDYLLTSAIAAVAPEAYGYGQEPPSNATDSCGASDAGDTAGDTSGLHTAHASFRRLPSSLRADPAVTEGEAIVCLQIAVDDALRHVADARHHSASLAATQVKIRELSKGVRYHSPEIEASFEEAIAEPSGRLEGAMNQLQAILSGLSSFADLWRSSAAAKARRPATPTRTTPLAARSQAGSAAPRSPLSAGASVTRFSREATPSPTTRTPRSALPPGPMEPPAAPSAPTVLTVAVACGPDTAVAARTEAKATATDPVEEGGSSGDPDTPPEAAVTHSHSPLSPDKVLGSDLLPGGPAASEASVQTDGVVILGAAQAEELLAAATVGERALQARADDGAASPIPRRPAGAAPTTGSGPEEGRHCRHTAESVPSLAEPDDLLKTILAQADSVRQLTARAAAAKAEAQHKRAVDTLVPAVAPLFLEDPPDGTPHIALKRIQALRTVLGHKLGASASPASRRAASPSDGRLSWSVRSLPPRQASRGTDTALGALEVPQW